MNLGSSKHFLWRLKTNSVILYRIEKKVCASRVWRIFAIFYILRTTRKDMRE